MRLSVRVACRTDAARFRAFQPSRRDATGERHRDQEREGVWRARHGAKRTRLEVEDLALGFWLAKSKFCDHAQTLHRAAAIYKVWLRRSMRCAWV